MLDEELSLSSSCGRMNVNVTYSLVAASQCGGVIWIYEGECLVS